MGQTSFDVGMTCNGCSNAVKKILGKIEGVSDVAADWETKKVVVTASDDVTAEVLLAKLMKWSKVSGKSVALSA
eukprot:CAMPEP_0194277282 /NCGR_PEP_ID=MMETSP0169-20130528/9649_1 /TAXON_ID=218684 /ORGANISM="Corethron pennatum, Strain L29A3" /LENGTH=73 /DNA_ID=CAMNT_0039021209 /DNA_START=215 /DNA_END=436 /DNA_ORIENTATION=-